jgi:hypothetical protein
VPGETSVNKIPFPLDADAPDGPTQIKALAELLDTLKWGSRNLKPTAGMLGPEIAPLELTGSYGDLPGITQEVTPAVASNIFVVGLFSMMELTAGGGIAEGTLKLDATDQLGPTAFGTVLNTYTASAWILSLSAEKHTIKLRAKRSGGSGGKAIGRMLYAYFAS